MCTFDIHKKLMDALTNMKWDVETVESIDGEDKIKVVQQGNMYDFYEGYLRAFGEVLTDMERIGIKVSFPFIVALLLLTNESGGCVGSPQTSRKAS